MTQPEEVRVKALLLAAGLGTRLRPLTESLPKCLVPIRGRPLLGYWLDLLHKTSIRDILINTHHLHQHVAAYLDHVRQEGRFRIGEAHEPELLGSAGTISANRAWMDDADACLVIYADNLSNVDLESLLRFHQSHGDPLTMMLFRSDRPSECGIAELADKSRIISFVEKPSVPKSDLANAGVYVLTADAYREIADRSAFDLGHDVLPAYVGRMRGWLHEGYHRDIGCQKSLAQAQREAGAAIPGLVGRRAVFLDRDGTLIEDVCHLTDHAKVKLLPGVANAIRCLQSAGYICVLATNQSVVGRGMITMAGLDRIHDELARQLAEHEVKLDGWFSCPIAPRQGDRTVVEHLDRKPGPGMLWRAARAMNLDVSQSWMVGDTISDTLAACNAGCRGAVQLVSTAAGMGAACQFGSTSKYTAKDLAAAAKLILDISGNDTKN